MNNEKNIEQFIKNELNERSFPFDEAMWNKMDEQLLPIREAYHKKERRKVIAYWSMFGVIALSGLLYLNNKNNSGKQVLKANSDSEIASNSANSSKQTTTTISPNNTTTDINNKVPNNLAVDAATIQNKQNLSKPKVAASYNNENITNKIRNNETWENAVKNASIVVKVIPTNNTIKAKQVAPSENEKTIGAINKDNATSNNNELVQNSENETLTNNKTVTQNNNESATLINKEKKVPEIRVDEKVISTEEIAKVKTVESNAADTLDSKKGNVAKKNSTANVAKKKVTKNTTPLEYIVNGGLNFSSPFEKAGYYGGIQFQKQIDDKKIFFGVKVAHNNLHHQLIASSKVNSFPQMADAVINKMTTIQVPFGYQFNMRNKKPNGAILNVGFEPTLLTGLQTIYYDDMGIPGGPRTAVMNSKLLENAVNKFNVSFMLGVQQRLSKNWGYNVNAGYGLINITDKQYYNKTNTNNNLKYVQVGLLYWLK